MANLFDQANERKKWDATIAQVGQMGYPQNPAQPPAFTSPQPRRPTSFGDAAAATNNPGVTQLPNSPAQGNGWRTKAVIGGAADDAAANRLSEPATPAAPVPAAPAQPASTSGGLNAPWWSGEYATAARLSDKSGLELEQQRAAAATPSQAPADDPVKRIINTGTLSMPQAVTKPADVAPAAPTAPNPTDQRLADGTQQATMPAGEQTQQPSIQSPNAGTGQVTRTGNSYAGTDVTGDITVNGRAANGSVMTLPAGASPFSGPTSAAGFQAASPSGAISTQNMGAADNLAARGQMESMGRLMASGQIQAPGAGPSFIMQSNTGFRRDPRLVAPEDAARRTLRYAQGDDPASRERKAKFQTAQLEQQGLAQRNQATNDIAQKELALKTEAQGFTTRAAQQMEQLRNALLDPKATPEQRKQAQEYLQALAISGKEPSPQYKSYVMPPIKHADGSTSEGSVYQENTRTGEGRWVKQQGDGQALPKPASKAEFDALPKGARFTDPNGQVRIK